MLISVVIVTYNSAAVVKDCLTALGPPRDDLEVIVVDNGSTDDTVAAARTAAPDATIVRVGANLGFAGGVHRGVTAAHGDVLCLLNPDAVATGVQLVALAGRLLDDETIGVIAPLVEHPSGRLRVASAGRLPTVWRMLTHYSGLSRLARRASWLEGHYLLREQLVSPRDVDWVTGACLLVRRADWEETGGLSRRWFMYAEDIEFCYRMGRLGRRVLVDTEQVVLHSIGDSSGERSSTERSDWVLNLYDFYAGSLSCGPVARAAWKLVVAGGLWTRALAYALRGGEWRAEGRRFLTYGADLLRASLASIARRNAQLLS